MFGDAGNDRLLMNSGQDFLSGGQGSDRFETLNLQGDPAPVTILDFTTKEDVLVLQAFDPLHTPNTSMSFDDLDTNDDHVLSASDTLLTKQSVTIDGVAKDSLVFLQIDGESDSYVPLMTFWGVTDLGRSDVIG